jgi:hypothetical protein
MKEITDELINERLEEIGFGNKQADNEDARRESVLNHYHVKLTENLVDGDFNIYEESTADGYEVWVACHDINRVNICEDVYYYDSDLADVLAENIKWSNGSEGYEHVIYISDLNLDFIDEAFSTLFEELSMRFEEEVIQELVDEGYEYKLEEQTNEN